MAMILTSTFYSNSAIKLAPLLLGKLLCRKTNNDIIKFPITETEIYFGESDTACHASKGRTERTQVMYEAGGIAYIYLCYGVHNMLNIVTGAEDHPQAVLIRGVDKYNGPGKLTKALEINRSLNNKPLTKENGLWLEDNGKIVDYAATSRIGIKYASIEDQNKLWRFVANKC
ncbi:MAG: DNA-3-methyladenine glycosylase [Streptococcaceae bacterium]|jgi:DNA-3-methyladenine glycosylase|nr:DNA-3-methyladenine glycosylase [Streptococcaceae bacterium]